MTLTDADVLQVKGWITGNWYNKLFLTRILDSIG